MPVELTHLLIGSVFALVWLLIAQLVVRDRVARPKADSSSRA